MPASTKAQIERINQVSAMARTSWIVLLGYLAFIGVTLLGVEDADFFVPARQTRLPLVDVSIPTRSFFFFAPVLAAALYVYLQIVLLKLWDAFADLTETHHDDQPIGDHLNPWLVNDWALTQRGGPWLPARPLRALGNLASLLLVWLAAPLILAGFWWRSMPAHDAGLTLLLAASLLVACAAGLTGWRTARAWLRGERPPLPDRPPVSPAAALREFLRNRRSTSLRPTLSGASASFRQHAGICALAAALVCLSLLRTVWPLSDNFLLARADLTDVEMVALPEGWRGWTAARSAYREAWCRREGLTMAVCGKTRDPDPPPQTARSRRDWCRDHNIDESLPCTAAFADLDTRFDTDWRAEHRSAIADLPRLDLADRNLHGAQARRVTLVGAVLSGAQMQGADFRRAHIEGAVLRAAHMQRADLRGAQMEGTDLRGSQMGGTVISGAHMQRADLRGAHMRAAVLSGAQMEGADLRGSDLEGADLRGALMERADLSTAHLQQADLRGALIEGADLSRTQMDSADLRGALMGRADLSTAQMRGADLRGSKLEGANLFGARIEEANFRFARMDGVDLRLAQLNGVDLREARAAGADLRLARMEGADLRGARLTKSRWSDASIQLLTHFADFRSAQGLTQAQLDRMVGNAGTLLTYTPDNVQPLHVWSCWDTPPQGFDALIARMAKRGADPEALRAEFLCSLDNPRRKTGTPLPVDAPYPDGHPLAVR